MPTAYIYLPSLLSALTLNFSYAFRSSEARSDTDEITCISSLSDLTSEERQAYEKLRVKADNKKGR